MTRRENPETSTLLTVAAIGVGLYLAYQWLQSNCASGAPAFLSLCAFVPGVAPVATSGASSAGCLSNLNGAILSAAEGNANLAAAALNAMTLGDEATLNAYCLANPSAVPAIPPSVQAYITANLPAIESPTASI
jgi:hypothetical protein